jgi:PleD family two-component response regulator
MYKPRVLSVDDDPDIRDVIAASLESDYTVTQASCGKEALAMAKKDYPDVVILDYNMPDMQGPEVCQLLRKDPLFLNTPILMLTGKAEIGDKVKGLDAGIDDYMVKPFDPTELLARVRMLLRRSAINLDSNPLTRLPGNVSIARELEEKIRTKESFAVLYCDLNTFKALNDYYGFDRGDQVIKETARIIVAATQTCGTLHDFIGHIGGDDFVVITHIEKAEEMAKKIIADFDKTAPIFFDEKDRTKGYIETKGRDGLVAQFSVPSIAIAVITTENRIFTHVAQVSSVGAELKHHAKKFKGSKYVIDRRTT